MLKKGNTILKFIFLKLISIIFYMIELVMAKTNNEILSYIGSSTSVLRVCNIERVSNSLIALLKNPENLKSICDYDFNCIKKFSENEYFNSKHYFLISLN